jgi:hypothetical protein
VIFGIDYHGTFQRDVHTFREVVETLQANGHTCVLVTGIADGDQYAAEVRRDVGGLMPIVFAAGRWEREAAREAGFAVDVWIDDNSEYIAEQDSRRCVGMRALARPKVGRPLGSGGTYRCGKCGKSGHNARSCAAGDR